MTEQMSPQPSELDIILDNVMNALEMSRRGVMRYKRLREKLDRAREAREGRDELASGAQVDELESLEDLGNSPDERAGLVADSTVIHFKAGGMEEFFSDPDRAQWAEESLHARLVEDGVFEVTVPTEVGPGGRVLVPQDVRVWDQIDADVLEQGYAASQLGARGDAEFPLAIAYAAGKADLDGTVSVDPEYYLDDSARDSRVRVRSEEDRLVVDEWVPFSVHENADGVLAQDRETLRDAALWLGAVEDADNGLDGVYFPITTDLKETPDAIGARDVPVVLSDRDLFVQAEPAELEVWAARERAVREGTVPESELNTSWSVNGTDGVELKVGQLADGNRLVAWERNGVLTSNPDGAPSVILDEQNRLVAAGGFTDGSPSGSWMFTDPKSRSYTSETCSIDPATGRAHEVRARKGGPSSPLERRADLDGALVATTMTTAVTATAAAGPAASTPTPSADGGLSMTVGSPSMATDSHALAQSMGPRPSSAAGPRIGM